MNSPRIHLSGRVRGAVLAALAVALLIGGGAWREISAAAMPHPAVAEQATAPAPMPSRAAAIGGRESYADIVKVVAPAVVTIRTQGGPARRDQHAGRRFLPPLLRRTARRDEPRVAAQPAPARAWLRRHRQQRRLHPDEQSCRRWRRRDARRYDGRPRARREGGRHRCTERPGGAEDQRHRAADASARQLRRGAGRRRRAGGRQPARHRPDRDDGDRQREGPVDRRRGTAATRTSCRPTRRSTRATRAARWST